MKQRMGQVWHDNRYFFIFILLMVVFRSSLADWNTVPTGSMKPTIVEGDRIWVNKLAYDVRLPLTHISLLKIADPQRGDIVVFDSETAGKRLVKRVIGLPGDVVAMRGDRLFVNGVPADYSAVKSQGNQAFFATESIAGMTHRIELQPARSGILSSFGPVKVPEGEYLVLGDNRDNSADSRVHGFVPREEIVGRSKNVVMSLNYDNFYLPRPDRFFHDL